jgi:hypothetical protein
MFAVPFELALIYFPFWSHEQGFERLELAFHIAALN